MRFILTLFAGTFSLKLLSYAARADNDMACGAALCLAGEAMGLGGGAGCANYLNAYFSIAVLKGGVFNAGDTMSECGNFLDQPSSTSSSERSSANNQFGPLEFLS